MSSRQEFISGLYSCGVIKLGQFTLKSGKISPIYFDFRALISQPKILSLACGLLGKSVEIEKFDCCCGVPYGAVPYATGLSLQVFLPMIMRRKEIKDHGTQKLIEGNVVEGSNCLVVEDVITSGGSILENVMVLRANGIKVDSAVVLLDRGQGAKEMLNKHGINVYSVLTVPYILDYLMEIGEIDLTKRKSIEEALAPTTGDQAAGTEPKVPKLSWKIADRPFTNPKVQQLAQIMEKKKSNLCVAADFTKTSEVLNFLNKVGPHICMLKIHSDIIEDFSMDFAKNLRVIAKDLRVMIFEDRKLADTGSTVELQLTSGPFQFSTWADFITVHSLPGPAVLEGMKKAFNSSGVSCFLISELSCKGALTQKCAEYKSETVKLAKEYRPMVAGFICQRRCIEDSGFLFVTPGVNMCSSGDSLGQQWRSPSSALSRDLNDIIIVGRGITKATDVVEATKEYKQEAWKAIQAK